MPAIDSCQPQVIRALEKDGWAVEPIPFQLKVQVYIDIEAKQQVNGSKNIFCL